mgnify:FL=1
MIALAETGVCFESLHEGWIVDSLASHHLVDVADAVVSQFEAVRLNQLYALTSAVVFDQIAVTETSFADAGDGLAVVVAVIAVKYLQQMIERNAVADIEMSEAASSPAVVVVAALYRTHFGFQAAAVSY